VACAAADEEETATEEEETTAEDNACEEEDFCAAEDACSEEDVVAEDVAGCSGVSDEDEEPGACAEELDDAELLDRSGIREDEEDEAERLLELAVGPLPEDSSSESAIQDANRHAKARTARDLSKLRQAG
jgi:hypothetical protein